nr:MAG: holin family protein [Bacteriophage sp.]
MIKSAIDNVTETTTQSLFKASMIGLFGECTQIIYDLRWMILLAIILILSDLWFGISASRVQDIVIRKSRAGRRTLNKLVDYICYILLGAVIGKAIGEPYGVDPIEVSITIIILCYCFEIDSIYGHICEIHGIKKQYSIWKIIFKLLTLKFNELGEAFRDMVEQKNNFKNTKNNENVL